MQDMEYDTPPGRSYRYYTGKPLFEFGDGLSLTTFSHTCTCEKEVDVVRAARAYAVGTSMTAADDDVRCSCTVKNIGAIAGDEVVMVFDALSAPIRATIGKTHPVSFQWKNPDSLLKNPDFRLKK